MLEKEGVATLFVGVNVSRQSLLFRTYISNKFCVNPFVTSTCNHGRNVAAMHRIKDVMLRARHVFKYVMMSPPLFP